MHSRICLLCASLLMGVSVYGQSLKINEVDKFSKEKKYILLLKRYLLNLS